MGMKKKRPNTPWPKGIPRRRDAGGETSTKNRLIALTPGEDAMWLDLAWQLEVTVSEMVRDAVQEKYDRVVAPGKKPPRK